MNAEKFQQKILCYSDLLFRMAKSILHDECKSQDVFQDTVLKLWEKRNQLNEISNYRAFSLTAIRNQCIDVMRKEQELEELPQSLFVFEPDPHQQLENADTTDKIKQLIDGLPELQRTIVRLRDVEEMELDEIAQTMGMTENAVCTNLSRARKKLREMILQQQTLETKNYERYRKIVE